MEKPGIKVRELLNLLPEEVLDKIAEETKVDRNVKRLTGKSLFRLLLFCFVGSERVSLRLMETAYESKLYKEYKEGKVERMDHTSLSDRLQTINYKYFESLFEELLRKVSEINPKKALEIIRFDSTIINLSSKLLQIGKLMNKGKYRQIKLTVGFNHFPRELKIYSEGKGADSEEIALKEAILSHSAKEKEGIVVFDRGLRSRKTYGELKEKEIYFVTRLNSNARYKRMSKQNEVKGQVAGSLELIEDIEVQLAAKGTRWLKPTFRLVTTKEVRTGKEYNFLTNIEKVSAEEITEIYKKRWDIEVFFRFIKQELNAKRFISRSFNGICVIVYMVLILSVLLLLYKIRNCLSGYKLVKFKFMDELFMEIVREVALFCGADPGKLHQYIEGRSG